MVQPKNSFKLLVKMRAMLLLIMDQFKYPQFFPQYYFKKATINIEGGTAVELKNQSHLLTKDLNMLAKLKPEEAKFKYSNLGGGGGGGDIMKTTILFKPVKNIKC